MAEPESFTAWLHAQGLREKTAQAIVTELGIESYEVLQACTDSITLRAELFSLTKQKFPFAMYAEFHKFVESCLELHIFQPEGPLVDILCSLFEVVSREFFSCSQKLSSLKSPSMSYADENTHLGINISDVCSHQQEEHGGRIQLENLEDAVDPQSTIPPSSQRSLNKLQERLEYASPTQSSNAVSTEPDVIVVVKEEPNIVDGLISRGEIYPVQVESLEGNHASSSTEALSCVSVTEDSYDLQKESCSDSCSAAERSTDHFCELKSRSPLALKEGFFRKQMHRTDSSRNMKSAGCDGRRKVEREFSKHKKIHFGGMQYKCLVCSKSFSNLRNMENHMKTQNGKCPLKCSICDKAVTKLSDLKKHMRIHNGERPYNCSVCGKSFTQIGNMNRHMMIHTGERPHNCPVCGRGFAESAKLNAHMRTHAGLHYGLPYSIS